MRVGKLSARDIKNLELSDVPFRFVTLVHGPNGVGKSNLLLLLHTLLSRKEVPPELKDQVRLPIEGLSRIPDFLRRTCQTGTATLTLECYTRQFQQFARRLLNAGRGKGIPVPHQVSIDFEIRDYSDAIRVIVTEIRLGTRPIFGPRVKSPASAETQSALEDWIAKEVAGSTVYIPANRVYKRDPVPLNLKVVEPAVYHLENAVLRMLTSPDPRTDTLEAVKKTMKDFFKIQDIRSELRPSEVRDSLGQSTQELLVGVRLQEGSGDWFDLERMGTGIQQLLVIVCMIHLSGARIALIEEFDSSLSPGKRNQLTELLKQLVGETKPLRQIIASSHTTFEPRQDRVLSLGAERTLNSTVKFRPWTKSDWARFSAGGE
jgi:energy-coupling factor transporter ATP-binding protein EcfA2